MSIKPKHKKVKEIFLDIEDYEGLYQVSQIGNVKSLERYKDNNGGRVLVCEKILKLAINKKGYSVASLCKNGKQKTVPVHRLVALSFIRNPNNKPQVNHINEIKTDNRVSNLEWCTNRENTTHSFNNKKSTSKYIGVHYSKSNKKWCAQIRMNGKSKHLGFFTEELDAHNAYQNKLKEINES
jgi:hypothetical protein